MSIDPNASQIISVSAPKSDPSTLVLGGVPVFSREATPSAEGFSTAGTVVLMVSGANGIGEGLITAVGGTIDAMVVANFSVEGGFLNASVALFADPFPNITLSTTLVNGVTTTLIDYQTAIDPDTGPYTSLFPGNFGFRGGMSAAIPLGPR